MNRSRKQMLREDRKRLENPYAHVEELELLDSGDILCDEHHELKFGDPQLHQDRFARENPYAHLNGDGIFSAITRPNTANNLPGPSTGKAQSKSDQLPCYQVKSRKKPGQYREEEIAQLARNLQIHIWKHRHIMCGGNPPTDPLKLLDPERALLAAGYNTEIIDGLGTHDNGQGRQEVAGAIDPAAKRVLISAQFPLDQRRFTMAHELGHAVLHNPQGAIHRDRAFDGVKRSPDPVEREADKFAKYFLMPERLVVKCFTEIFGSPPFMLTEETAFALSATDLASLEEPGPTLRDLSLLLATTERYNGRQFISLCDRFGVSKYAMAIRLEELALIKM